MNTSELLFRLAAKFEFTSQVRQRFYTKLAQLLENGVSLDQGLMQLSRYNASKGSVMPKLYMRWRRNVANGVNFGTCVADYIPSSEAILLETGADSGHLVDALYNVASAVEQQSRVRGAIIGNGAYPMLLVALLIAFLSMASYQIIPTFSEILPIEKWRGLSYVVAKVSFFIKDYGIIIFGGTAVLLVGMFVSMPYWTGKSRVYFDYIIPWNMYRLWQGSAFLLAVSALMSAGVKLDEVSLNKIGRKADPYLSQRIQAIKRWIMSGANLGEALHQAGYRFPDDELIADLRIYATLRGFDENLLRITNTWVNEIIDKVSASMKVLNIFILVLIAITIGCLLFAMYGVIQQVSEDSGR